MAMFHILHQNALQVSTLFDRSKQDNREYAEHCQDLEGHIETLQCELDKAKVYQT